MDKIKNKVAIQKWIQQIDKTEIILSDIVALSFNLYQPYGIELVGSKWFDDEDEDWACDEDFVPQQRSCPGFDIENDADWETVLDFVIEILNELKEELPESNVFSVMHVATGFVDGNLVIIK